MRSSQKEIHEELISAMWYLTKLLDWCLSEEDKKELELIFTDKVEKS